jgi:signal peptidase I
MLRAGLVIGFLACLVAAAAFLLLTRDMYVVQSSSMKPTLQPGDAVVVKPLDGPVRAGQVITYKVQGKLITHRVTRVEGDTAYTRGDAADEEDPWPVERSAIRGQMDFRIPYGGYVILFLRQPLGFLSVIALPVLLFLGIEGGKRRERRRSGKAARAQRTTGAVRRRGGRTIALLAFLVVVAAIALAARDGGGKAAVRKPAKRPVRPAKAGLAAAALVVVAGCLAGALHAGGVLGFFAGTSDELLAISTAPSFEPIPATVDIDPDTLELRSKGQPVTAYIELREGFDVGHIDVPSVRLCVGQVTACPEDASVGAQEHPSALDDYDGDTVPDLMVKFDRQDLIELLGGETGDVTITLTGMVSPPGRSFGGSDTVRVIASEGQEDAPSGDEEDMPLPLLAPPPPASAPPVEYEVQPGDTLWDIATRFGTTVEALVRLNGLQNANLILYGSTLNVPYVGEDAGGAPADVSP